MDSFAEKWIANGQTSIANYFLSNFTKIGMTPNEFIMFLQIKRYSDEGIQFPNINKITASTGYSKSQAYEILHKMIQKKLMTIVTTHDQNHDRCDKYDFTLAYQKLDQLSHQHRDLNDNWQLNRIDRSDQSRVTVSSRTKVFKAIEREFGRQLSPMEISAVSKWFDVEKFVPKMILLALREAVLSQVFNLRYIGKILVSWQRRGITTPQRLQNVKDHRKSFFSSRRRNSHHHGPKIPIIKL